jgi:GNAT superfamily N-acetyltransferase
LTAAVQIRPATVDDVELIHKLIVGLAEYEDARDKVKGNPATLATVLFGPRPAAEVVIAELSGEPAGFALFYETFSTWESQPGIWLEDLYVLPEQRRGGIGEALLQHVAAITHSRGYSRLEWVALNWNTPALEFYAKHGAETMDEWTIHRLSGAGLARTAG